MPIVFQAQSLLRRKTTMKQIFISEKPVSPKLKCHLVSKVEMSLLGVGVTFPGLESGVAKPWRQG